MDRYNNVKYNLCRYGYLATNSDYILNSLYNWSLNGIGAYKALIDLYLECDKKEIYDFLNKNLTQEKSELLESRINKR